MHDVQRITVTGDLFFVTVAWRRPFNHELAQSGFRCSDALDGVGRFGALHLGKLHQSLQFLRLLLEVCGLFSFVLMNKGQVIDDLVIPCPVLQSCIIKMAHLVTSNRFLVNYIHFDEKNQRVIRKNIVYPLECLKSQMASLSSFAHRKCFSQVDL